jgi:hypothetical protein
MTRGEWAWKYPRFSEAPIRATVGIGLKSRACAEETHPRVAPGGSRSPCPARIPRESRSVSPSSAPEATGWRSQRSALVWACAQSGWCSRRGPRKGKLRGVARGGQGGGPPPSALESYPCKGPSLTSPPYTPRAYDTTVRQSLSFPVPERGLRPRRVTPYPGSPDGRVPHFRRGVPAPRDRGENRGHCLRVLTFSGTFSRKESVASLSLADSMVRPRGFEPLTFGFGGQG